MQVIASLDGTILWVSGQLPGSIHDTAGARIFNILAALRQAGLIALADKGYHGYDPTGQQVITPHKGRNRPESQKVANRAYAQLRRPGERANAQLNLAHPAQTPQLPTPHRPTRESHPRPTEPRDHQHERAHLNLSGRAGLDVTYPCSRPLTLAATLIAFKKLPT